MGGIFPPGAQVMLPPLIGGFVGSDALACLAYFHYDRPDGPMVAIDLGTNGEVLVTDGKQHPDRFDRRRPGLRRCVHLLRHARRGWGDHRGRD